jgi:hypothetical protein
MRSNELSSVLIDKIKFQERDVVSGDTAVVLRQNARTSYNAEKLSKHIPLDDFASLVSVSPTKFKKYLDKNPSVLPIVEDISETNFTSAFLATRKLKK